MPSPRTFRVTYDVQHGVWRLKQDGVPHLIGTYPAQEAALVAGQKSARKNSPCELVMHRKDGSLELEWTYGATPYAASPRSKLRAESNDVSPNAGRSEIESLTETPVV